MVKKPERKKTYRLFKKAEQVLVGGVDSPARAFTYIGDKPLLIRRGKGAKVYDYDNNTYIDYVLSYGALILGHAHEKVLKSIKETMGSGLAFGTTTSLEVQLAERIKNAIPLLNKIRFTTSGTEAVMGAVRLARGVTGRDKIIKFSHSYHGHADYLLAKAGSGLATLGLPASKGVPRDFTKHTLVAPFGDNNRIEKIFKKHGSDIAAVLVEPVGGNNGVTLPDIRFLKNLRKLTRRFGSLLIFDEVITGFRFHFGSCADYFKIKPDIICLGKIIGGGLPIGAYGGSRKIMEHLAPLGSVYQASTFSGNPVVMSAGLATLNVLESLKKDYKRIEQAISGLSRALEETAEASGIGITVRHFGSMFSIRFEKKKLFQEFYKILLGKGVYLAPSEYESNFLSFAHKKSDINKTVAAVKEAFNLIEQNGRKR